MHRLDVRRMADHGQAYGTFSAWDVDGRPFCYGVELPWNDNRRGLSCIPPGEYLAELYDSPAHGLVYQLIDVPGRSNIQIHAANFGDLRDKDGDGDREGNQLEGCLAPGDDIAVIADQRDSNRPKLGVTNSRNTLRRFMAAMEGEKRIRVVIHAIS